MRQSVQRNTPTATRLEHSKKACRANAVLTDLVRRVEKAELQPDPRHITELRLN